MNEYDIPQTIDLKVKDGQEAIQDLSGKPVQPFRSEALQQGKQVVFEGYEYEPLAPAPPSFDYFSASEPSELYSTNTINSPLETTVENNEQKTTAVVGAQEPVLASTESGFDYTSAFYALLPIIGFAVGAYCRRKSKN